MNKELNIKKIEGFGVFDSKYVRKMFKANDVDYMVCEYMRKNDFCSNKEGVSCNDCLGYVYSTLDVMGKI